MATIRRETSDDEAIYYPRFSFQPAGRFGIRCQFDVPPAAFMVRLFDETVLERQAGAGILYYHSAFAAV